MPILERRITFGTSISNLFESFEAKGKYYKDVGQAEFSVACILKIFLSAPMPAEKIAVILSNLLCMQK